MQLVRSSDGRPLKLASEIGRGGEGTVFSVEGAPNLAIKVYREDLRAKRQAKIEAMVQATNPGIANFVAWPTFAVYQQTGGGGFCGFAMPKVERDYLEIHYLYGPSSRRQKFPGRDWRFLVRAAENLATAVAEVHGAGHVLGDINHKNALVNNDALVHFIDVDSFQLRHEETLHRCTVGFAEFTPPELQGLNLSTVERTVQHDRFGLAVLIFRLLFMGRHPFAGRFTRGDISLPDAIKQGLFAFSTTMADEATPPPNTLDLQDVGESLATLFERAFLMPLSATHGRPDGHSWVRALKLLQNEVNRCRSHPHHYYPGGNRPCVWCDFRTHGIDYFPDPAATPPSLPAGGTAGGQLAIDDTMVARLWAAVVAVPRRPRFDESMLRRQFEVAPLPPLQASSGWPVDGGTGCAGLIIVGSAFVCAGPVGLVVATGLVALYLVLGPALQRRSISSQERDPQREALVTETHRREQLASKLSGVQSMLLSTATEHEDSWRRLMASLENAHRGLLGREAAKAAEIRTATDRLAVGQEESFLQSNLIRTASISGVGDALTSNLISYGFESAYDVLNAGASVSVHRSRSAKFRPPDCPRCGSTMQKRRARRGRNAGGDFWGCPRYPSCTGTRDISYMSRPSSTTTSTTSGLEQVPGIGPVKAAEIVRWAKHVKQQFRPSINPSDLARERQRIESAYNVQVQQLAQQLGAGPAELTAINDRFSAMVAPYVLEFQALEKEW